MQYIVIKNKRYGVLVGKCESSKEAKIISAKIKKGEIKINCSIEFDEIDKVSIYSEKKRSEIFPFPTKEHLMQIPIISI